MHMFPKRFKRACALTHHGRDNMVRSRKLVALLGFGALASTLACNELPNTQPADDAISFMKGGNGGGGRKQETPLAIVLLNSSTAEVTTDGRGAYVDGEIGVVAFIDDFNDLRFDLNKPKRGLAQRAMCFDFSNPIDLVVSDPLTGKLCGVTIWNTRNVPLRDITVGSPQEGTSRFIFNPGEDVQYKVRYGDSETACLGLELGAEDKSGIAVTGTDEDNDGMLDSWTLDATDRVAFVSRAPKNQGFHCVGTFRMSWKADLARTNLN